jgi:outer membrane protein
MKKAGIFRKPFTAMVFAVLMILNFGSFGQGRIWTLEDCVNYAIENNIQIKQTELGIENSEINMLEGKLNLLPNLNGSANYSYSWGRVLDKSNYVYINRETKQSNFGLDASVLLWGGFQNLNTIKKNKIDFMSSQFAADKMKDDISLLIAQAYLSVLFNKELLDVARKQALITQQQVDRTNKLVEAGTLARGSLLEVQAQLAREEITIINYENSLGLAYLDLLQILDLPSNSDFDIDVPELDIELALKLMPVSEVYEFAVVNQPDIKSGELNVESAYKSVAIAKGRLSPTISMAGGWNTNYSNQYFKYDPITGQVIGKIPFEDQFKDNQSSYLGFSLNIPIFNGYQVSSSISRAKVAAANEDYNFQLTKNTLRKNIEMAYNDAQSGFKTYVATEKSLKSFEESYRYTEQKFNVGLANSVDYNLSKSQLTAAESELLRAKYDYIFKSKILDFYMGIPITLQN